MGRRTYTDGADTVIARRIASADRAEAKPVVVGGMDKFNVGAVPATTAEDKAAALAYLTRHDALDVAEILGLTGTERAPRAGRLPSRTKTKATACPYCEAQPGDDCRSSTGERVTYHRDRIRVAKEAVR